MIVKELLKVHEKNLDCFDREREKLLIKLKDKNIEDYKRKMISQQIKNYEKLIIKENKKINKLTEEIRADA